MEPMSNDPQDAYPILSCDVALEGYSLSASIFDYTENSPAPGDFLLDLWIWAPASKEMVQPQKVKLNNINTIARMPFVPVNGDVIVEQKVKGGKALLGYNVYYAHEADPYEFVEMSFDTTYTHSGAGMILGLHNYYVTAQYEEGESDASNIATEYISGISENGFDNLHIYPNPVIDVLHINSDEEIDQIQVININGQIVHEANSIEMNSIQINLSNQPAGIYNVRIQLYNSWMNHKIIKK
jgi:hypothetical protein